MHIHVLGTAPFGHLLAFHLRRHAQHKVTLFLSQTSLADPTRPTPTRAKLAVETSDSLETQPGFECEPWDVALNALHAVVFNKKAAKGKQNASRAGSSFLPSAEPSDEPIKSLIITTKPTSVVPALRYLEPRLDASSTLVLLQEGMGIYDALVRQVFRNPDQRPHFILGNSSHAVWKRDPFHIVQHRVGGLKFGIVPDPRGRDFERSQDASIPRDQRTLRLDDIYSGEKDDERYRSLRDTVAALLEVENELHSRWMPMAAMQRRLQRQCVVHSCSQPVAALLNCRIGAIPTLVPAQRIVKNICREASAIFAAQKLAEDPGNPLGPPEASGLSTRLLYDEVMQHCVRLAGARPQMAYQFDRRVLTDVDFFNGYLQSLGEKFSVPTPSITMLLEMVKMKHYLRLRGISEGPPAFPYLGQDSTEP